MINDLEGVSTDTELFTGLPDVDTVEKAGVGKRLPKGVGNLGAFQFDRDALNSGFH